MRGWSLIGYLYLQTTVLFGTLLQKFLKNSKKLKIRLNTLKLTEVINECGYRGENGRSVGDK